jgi:hypothetical protein
VNVEPFWPGLFIYKGLGHCQHREPPRQM